MNACLNSISRKIDNLLTLERLLNILVALTALCCAVALCFVPGVLDGHGTQLWQATVIFCTAMATINTVVIALMVIPKDFGRLARDYNEQVMSRVATNCSPQNVTC